MVTLILQSTTAQWPGNSPRALGPRLPSNSKTALSVSGASSPPVLGSLQRSSLSVTTPYRRSGLPAPASFSVPARWTNSTSASSFAAASNSILSAGVVTPTQVIVGSTTVVIGPNPVTVTAVAEPDIIVGPSGIEVGTDSYALSQVDAPTAVSLDGAIVSISPGQALTSSTMPSANAPVLQFPAAASFVNVVVDGQTWMLPPSGSMSVQKQDGSYLTFGADYVKTGSQTYNVPPITAPSTISAAGSSTSILALPLSSPPPSAQPPCSGLCGFFKTMAGIAGGSAVAIVSDISSIGQTATQWANKGISDNSLFGAISSFITSGTRGKLNWIQPSLKSNAFRYSRLQFVNG